MPVENVPHDWTVTQMIIPVSEKTFFNTNWSPPEEPLCPYDMLKHPPDYNPRIKASRRDPKVVRNNIWLQEYHKAVPSTSHFVYGRPIRKNLDPPTKEHVNVQVKNENPLMRLGDVLEWAVLITKGKELCTH